MKFSGNYSLKLISFLHQDGFVLDQDNNGEVADVCGQVYDESAKCNKYMGYDGEYNVSSTPRSTDYF